MSVDLAPVVLFAYNRPRHVQKTIEALQDNELSSQSDLIVISDGGKDFEDQLRVNDVRNYLHTISGFHNVQVIERPQNFGLAKSIVRGVTEIVNKSGRLIVLEDDLVTSPHFLRYMNEALALYEHEEKVASIHGYVYPVSPKLPETFFIRGADCLGWATWKRAWALFEDDAQTLLDELKKRRLTRQFDFNGAYRYTRMLKLQTSGKTTSWAIKWYASAFLENRLTLYPGSSLVQHIGNDNTGTNFGTTNFLDATLTSEPVKVGGIAVDEDLRAREILEDYLRRYVKTPLWRGALNKARRMFNTALKKGQTFF
jgi:glycosyltransferase involved in cell wall biosynthesis